MYRDHFEKNVDSKSMRFVCASQYGELNGLLHRWFTMARSKTFLLAAPILQEKALHFAREMSLSDFKASNGWLESWRKKYAIQFHKVCGESGDVNMETVGDYRSRLPSLVSGVEPADIYNCDETGLFFR